MKIKGVGAVELGTEIWVRSPCQACHGAFGEGELAPALRGSVLTLNEFTQWVRLGGNGMRGYSAQELADAEVESLHAWLRQLPKAMPTPIPNAYELTVPPMARISRYAEHLSAPTSIAFGPDGALYAAVDSELPEDHATGSAGQVWRLQDGDGDGIAERGEVVVDGLQHPTALLWLPASNSSTATLLVATYDGFYAWEEGGPTPRPFLVDGWTSQGLQVNDLAQGSDGFVYVALGARSAGSSGQHVPQPGSVWRFDPAAITEEEGSRGLEPFASGIRNAGALEFSPSGAIYLTDNGLGWPFREEVPDELNVLLGGGDYGWPDVWGDPPAQAGTLGPLVVFPPGSGASNVLYVSGRLFEEYANDLLVSLSAQGNSPGSPGRNEIVRVEIISDAMGYSSYVHPFIAGLRQPQALAEGPDGAIYVADAGAAAIYRLGRDMEEE